MMPKFMKNGFLDFPGPDGERIISEQIAERSVIEDDGSPHDGIFNVLSECDAICPCVGAPLGLNGDPAVQVCEEFFGKPFDERARYVLKFAKRHESHGIRLLSRQL